MPTLALYGTPAATERRGDKHDARRQQESVGEEAVDEGEGVVAGGAASELTAASVQARKEADRASNPAAMGLMVATAEEATPAEPRRKCVFGRRFHGVQDSMVLKEKSHLVLEVKTHEKKSHACGCGFESKCQRRIRASNPAAMGLMVATAEATRGAKAKVCLQTQKEGSEI
ncbi:hypothetical protein NL676_005874 [Syzygium grande]|nr:hypothetical protein NL676_005874 [Syzygium grande]